MGHVVTLLTAGWFGRPVAKRVRVRRSTVLLTAGFLGIGALYLQVRTDPVEDPPEEIVVIPSPSEP